MNPAPTVLRRDVLPKHEPSQRIVGAGFIPALPNQSPTTIRSTLVPIDVQIS